MIGLITIHMYQYINSRHLVRFVKKDVKHYRNADMERLPPNCLSKRKPMLTRLAPFSSRSLLWAEFLKWKIY